MNSIDDLQLRRIVRRRTKEHEKAAHDVIPMSRVELEQAAIGYESHDQKQFHDDLLRSVKQMKRGRAARKTTAA